MRESGKAVLEFALVLPFFLILILGAIDVFTLIQKKQQLAVITRELGNVTYRECSELQDTELTQSCLENSTEAILGFINNSSGVIAGAEVVVRSWLVVDDEDADILKGEFKTAEISSRFGPERIQLLNSYKPNLREGLITVEVYLPKNDDTSFFNRDLYDSVIF